MELWKFSPPTKNQNKQTPLICRGQHRTSWDFLLFAKLLSLSLAYLLPCSHLSTSLKCNLSKRTGSYVKERLSQNPRSGPVQDLSYGDLDLSGNQKTAPQLFPAPNMSAPPPPPPVINSSMGAANPGYQKSLNASRYTAAVTETFRYPDTTHCRGSRVVCKSQMAAIEPPVLPWNLMGLEWFADDRNPAVLLFWRR